MIEWQTTNLGSIASPERGAIAIGPFGSRMKADLYVADGVPVIRGTNISAGRSWKGDWVYVPADFASEMPNCLVRSGDLVFPHRGSVGEVALIPEDGKTYIISTSLMKFSVDRKKALPEFIYYCFKSSLGREEILRFGSQVGTPGIGQPLASLRQFNIVLPPLDQQKSIVSILSALDHKIDLIRCMNETLEAMARALFQEWFVDFGPVRARAEGRQPEGLSADVAALFPDALDEEGKPKGWLFETLGQHCRNFDSQRIPLSGADRAKRSGCYPYHGAAAVMDYVDDYIFDGDYLLVGEDGSVVGDRGLAITQYASGKFWVNNHAHVLQGKGAVITDHLRLYFMFEAVEPYVTGAVQAKLSQGRMNSMPFLFAGTAVCSVFGALIEPLFTRFRANLEEVKTLSALRDLLLPKLMSGEIRVKDAERLVEQAA